MHGKPLASLRPLEVLASVVTWNVLLGGRCIPAEPPTASGDASRESAKGGGDLDLDRPRAAEALLAMAA